MVGVPADISGIHDGRPLDRRAAYNTREVRVSGYNDYSELEDEFNESQQRGGGGLRKMLEEALAENKKLVQRLEKQDREKSTSDLLKEKGLDPAIAEIIPEGTDASAWVDKYAHLLGVPQNTEVHEPAAEPEAQLADDSDPALVARRQELADEQRALAAMQDAAESGYPPEVSSDLLSRMDKINTEAELIEFFNSNGALGG